MLQIPRLLLIATLLAGTLSWVVPGEAQDKNAAAPALKRAANDPLSARMSSGVVPATEEALLEKAGIKTDTASLVTYLNGRSGNRKNVVDVDRLVRELGDPQFQVREEATERLIAIGSPALEQLRAALKDVDQEVVLRAKRCLAAIDEGSQPLLLAAAARILAKRGTPEGADALIRYLPLVADDETEEAIWFSVAAIASKPGKLRQGLLPLLNDPHAARRAFAGCLLGRIGNGAQKAAVRGLLADADVRVRLRAAQGLLAGQDKNAVPVLIDLLSKTPLGIAWQAEELLNWLAAANAPAEVLGAGSPAARLKCQAAWQKWWQQSQATLKLEELSQRPYAPRLLMVREGGPCWNGKNPPSRISVRGGDGRARWQGKDLPPYCEAFWLPGDRFLLLDMSVVSQRLILAELTERDLLGKTTVLQKMDLGGIRQTRLLHRLPNGHIIVLGDRRDVKLAADGRVLRSVDRVAGLAPGQDVSPTKPAEETIRIEARGVTVQHKVNDDYREHRFADGHRLLLISGRHEQRHDNRLVELSGRKKLLWEMIADAERIRAMQVIHPLIRFGFDTGPGVEVGLDPLPGRIRALESKHLETRRRAAYLFLYESGSDFEPAIAALIQTMTDPTLPRPRFEQDGYVVEDVRLHAAVALGKLGPKAHVAVPAMLEAFDDLYVRRLSDVSDAISHIGAAALPALFKYAKDERAQKRAQAICFLARFAAQKNDRAFQIVMSALKDKSPVVREVAVGQLFRFQKDRPELTLAALMAALKDTDSRVAERAIYLLNYQGAGAEAAIPLVVDKLKDPLTCYSAAYLLGKIGQKHFKALAPAFLEALKREKGKDTRERTALIAALAHCKADARDAVPVLVEVLQSLKFEDTSFQDGTYEQQRALQSLCYTLGQIGPEAKQAVPLLVRLVSTKKASESVRGLAVAALERIDPIVGRREKAKFAAEQKARFGEKKDG
jgi:HEAT repeat protein